ncbi:hypothetical protein BH09ACT12_BH09ACT12_17450 [soil metagenome]
MTGELTISWGNLDHLFTSMITIQKQGVQIDRYFTDEVCNTAGFDYSACVLRPIADQLVKVGGVFSDVRGVFEDRWHLTTEAMVASAKQIDATDNQVNLDFSRYLGDTYGPYAPQQLPTGPGIEVEFFPLDEVGPSLEAPGEGEKTLAHNKEWEAITDSFDALRDTINSGISKINSIGVVTIERLTEKSLDEFVVYPLSGNYLKIQGNAAACDQVREAMSVWSMNFSRISGKSVAAMGGDVGLSLVAHLELYHLVTRAVGELIGLGSSVFNAIAKVSEKISVSVENALVTMAKILLRVSTRIASRLAGMFGWMLFVKDLVEKGAAAITDIIDDVKMAVEIISACFELKDAIEEWAAEKVAQLEAFEEMADIIQQLPAAVAGGDLGGLPPLDPVKVESSLADITYDFGEDPGPGDQLDDQLGDLEDEYPESLGNDDGSTDTTEPDDGDMLMAPGLPSLPGEPSTSLPMA